MRPRPAEMRTSSEMRFLDAKLRELFDWTNARCSSRRHSSAFRFGAATASCAAALSVEPFCPRLARIAELRGR